MLQLTQAELYKSCESTFHGGITNASNKLSQNVGVINPQNLEIALMDLDRYARTKSKSSPCLTTAITMYRQYGGRIQLFDLSGGANGRSEIPPFMPFIPGAAHRPDSPKPIPAIFVNLYRMGKWSDDGSTYEDINVPTDLHTCLESGYIAYKFIIENQADNILSNSNVLENLTRIYTKLFYDALIKVPGNLPLEDFQKEAAKFIIAKFFLIYVVQKNENDATTNNIARLAANAISGVGALQGYEENLGINYEKLTNFLISFGQVFFNGHPTSRQDFERAWLNMYGEGMALAVEYIPYLIHFLFATVHSSRLGGSSRLDKRISDLTQQGLYKLYNAVMHEVMK